MGRQIAIDPNDTSHIKRPKNSEPVAAPSTFRQTPEQWGKRTVADKQKTEWGSK